MHFRWFELCTEKIPESDTEGLFQHIPGSGYSPMFDYVSRLIGSWLLLVTPMGGNEGARLGGGLVG